MQTSANFFPSGISMPAQQFPQGFAGQIMQEPPAQDAVELPSELG